MLPMTGPEQSVGAVSNPQFVVDSAVPGYSCEGTSYTLRWALTRDRPMERSAKVPNHLKNHLHLPPPASYLLGSGTERASGNTGVA